MGGGRQCLQSEVSGTTADPLDTWSCYSKDGRDLIMDWKVDKKNRNVSYQVINNNEELENANLNAEFTLGETNISYLLHSYRLNIESGCWFSKNQRPSLLDNTNVGIEFRRIWY